MTLLLMKKLSDLWEKYPDLRFCQLINNLTCKSWDFYYVSDEELEKLIDDVMENGFY